MKQQLTYLKARNKKILKTNKNIVNVLANLSTSICHAFIQNKKLIPPHVNLASDSSDDECLEDATKMLKISSTFIIWIDAFPSS